MTIQQLQQTISQAVSGGNLNITQALLNSNNYTALLTQYNIGSVVCNSVTVGAVSGNQFTVTANSVEITINGTVLSNVSTSQVSLIFTADSSGEAQLSISYTLAQNWTLAQLFTAMENMFSVQASSSFPAYLNDITINDLAVVLNTAPVGLGFTMSSSMEILNESIALSLDLNISKETSGLGLSVGGNLSFSGQLFQVAFSHKPQDSSFTASWQDSGSPLTINNILSDIGLPSISIPSGVNLALGLTNASFSYNTQNKQVTMQVTTTDNFTAYFGSQNENQYYFAVALGNSFNLSSLASGLGLFQDITLNKLFVAIGNFTDSSFAIPNTPYTGITDGIEFRAQLSMSSSDSSSGLGQTVNFLGQSFGSNTLDISIDLSASDFTLSGELEGIGLDFPSASNKVFTINGIGLSLQSSPLKLTLNCQVVLDFNFQSNPAVTSLPITGSIFFEIAQDQATIGASLNENTTISYPFNIPILTVNNLGFAIEGNVGPEAGISFTLEGDVLLGAPSSTQKINEKFGATIALTDDLPNIAYFESDTQGAITMQQIWNACLPISAPAVLQNIVINDLDFYFCDEQEVLPDGTTVYPGTSFLAAFSIWSFSTFANLVVSTASASQKISGTLEMSPLNLSVGGTTIASITGNSKGNAKYNIQPGGAEIEFDTSTESFTATLDANILGLSENINASMSNGNLNIAFNQSIAGITNDSVTVVYTHQPAFDMSFSCNIEVGINCSPSIPVLGTIHINDSVQGGLAVTINGNPANPSFSAIVNGSFTWQGNTIHLVNIDIHENLTSLTDLASALVSYIESEAESLFSSFFASAEQYIEAVVNGVITDGEFIMNVLYNYYNVQNVENLLSDMVSILNGGYALNGTLNFHLDQGLPTIPSVGFHADLGTHLDIHADAGHEDFIGSVHADVGHADAGLSATFGTPSIQLPSLINVSANEHLDLTSSNFHLDVSVPLSGLSQHIDVGIVGGNVGVGGTVGLSTTFEYTAVPTSFNPHLDATADGGIHGDIVGLGGHGDVSAFHIDQSL